MTQIANLNVDPTDLTSKNIDMNWSESNFNNSIDAYNYYMFVPL